MYAHKVFSLQQRTNFGSRASAVINNLIKEVPQLGAKVDVVAAGISQSVKGRGFVIHYTRPPYEFHSLLKRIRTYSGKYHLVHSHTMICLSHAFFKMLNRSSPFLLQLHHSILKSERLSSKLNTLFHLADRILVLNQLEANKVCKHYNISRKK